MLHINNACIAFGTEVLFSGLNLNLERGKTACIVGQSGCGKTSLLNAVMGFVPLKEGTIKVGDTLLDKSTIDIIRRQIAWIPQELALPFEWVKEMVALPFDLKVNRSVPFSEERLYEYFDDLGLEHDLYTKRVNEVSGGQRQRIAIARGLMLDPDVVVADEPVSALDVSVRAQVLNLMMDLQAELGLSYVFISHDLSVVEHIADEVMVMYLGRCVEMGTKEQIFKNPQHPYTQALLSATPRLSPELRRQRIKLTGELPSPINPPKGCAFNPRCWKATDKCRNEQPKLEKYPDGKLIACFHLD